MVDRPAWFLDWSGEICAVVGSGPSASRAAVERLRGRCRVLVINTSYQLAPWADALYACDGRWWEWHKGAPDFLGIKITQDAAASARYGTRHVSLVDEGHIDANRLIVNRPGILGRGGNSGFQALNLAIQFGARSILLLGLDFCGDRWHGVHPNKRHSQKQSTLDGWRTTFDEQASSLSGMGIRVVNLSPISALTAYPKMDVNAALARWQ